MVVRLKEYNPLLTSSLQPTSSLRVTQTVTLHGFSHKLTYFKFGKSNYNFWFYKRSISPIVVAVRFSLCKYLILVNECSIKYTRKLFNTSLNGNVLFFCF